MQEMADGLKVVEQVFMKDAEASPHQEPEDAAASLDGQAFTRIQNESCLTDKGIHAMLEVLADTLMIQRYLLLQRKSIREDWIKQKMQ